MPRFGQNIFSSSLFADSDNAAFSYNSFSRLAAAPSGALTRQPALDAATAGFSTFKSGTAFVADGFAAAPTSSGLIIVTPDEAGDGIGVAPGNPVVTVDAASSTIGTIGTIGDQDFYKVTLVAGKSYEIGLFGHAGGTGLIPLQDAYIELYSAAGALLGSADGGASTLANQANSGFDAVLPFDVTVTGTYYINARAFDNDPTVGGSTGEGLGEYELYVHEIDPNDPNVYHPYYDAGSPLYAIDWGTQVDKVNHTDRNPDGNEGTRSTGGNGIDPTGNPQGSPTYIADVPALAAAQGKDITGKNVVTIYFAKAGDTFVSNDPTNPGLPPATITATGVKAFEYNAVWTALDQFAKVADVVYIEVQDRAKADFIYTSYIGTPGPGVSLLGSMSPPGESDEGLAQFNSGDYRWNAVDLQQGGFSFVTLIHEFGHGHGLAHPHDNGGHSGIMNGVESDGPVADYTTGDYDLNQGVFTMMSYEDGWQTSPYGNAETDVGYGYLGGLMAFDIAAIQDKYGVNEDYATGNDVYTLKDVNAAGTFYTSIWDGGGTDSIVYNGTRNANIDLRQATLKYEPGGGGYVSYAYGIFGGFTIANGVTIENASSGSGNDTLIGNAAANRLDGGAGTDRMEGGLGDDSYIVDNASDVVVERANEGYDTVVAAVSYTLSANVENLQAANIGGTAALALTGNDVRNFIWGTQGNNVINGAGGADFMVGYAGDDLYGVDNMNDVAYEEAGGGYDTVATSISYTLGANIENLQAVNIGGTDPLALTGNEVRNFIWGTQGNNVLNGAGGADFMVGYGGDDGYFVDNAGDVAYEEAGGGYDTVVASASYTLGANVENLQAANIGGSDPLALAGNDLRNFIWGTQGNNVLAGRGGNDVLFGYAGADQFLFDTAAGNANYDWLGDFQAGTDKIVLDNSVFTALGDGALSASAFVTGSAAGDADDRIIFDSATGNVYYDADGNGSGAALLLAVIPVGQALTANDFLVI
jgi:hypothetical protein